jgi:hypothetical protein
MTVNVYISAKVFMEVIIKTVAFLIMIPFSNILEECDGSIFRVKLAGWGCDSPGNRSLVCIP